MKTEMSRHVLIYVDAMKLGDALVSLPILRAYRQARPQDHVVLVAGRGTTLLTRELAPIATGVLDEVVEEMPLSWRGLGRWLQGRHIDVWIDTQRRLPDTMKMLLLAKLHGAAFISSTAGYRLSDRKPQSGERKPAATKDLQIQLLELAAEKPLQVKWQSAAPLEMQQLAERLLPVGTRYIGLCPGAADRRRCWPIERFITLAHQLSERGMTPVWLLGPQERDWEERLRRETPQALFPTYDQAMPAAQSVMFSLALAARMALNVANDSGVGHLAAASGAPLISLSRRSDALKWAPLASRLVLLNARDYGSEEMSAIPLEDILRAAEELLR